MKKIDKTTSFCQVKKTKYNRISFDRFGGPDRTRFDYTNFERKSTSFCTVEILKKYSCLKYILKIYFKNYF